MVKLLEKKFLKYLISISSHEGLIATLDEELIEEDYDDIQEEKFSRTSQKGWAWNFRQILDNIINSTKWKRI